MNKVINLIYIGDRFYSDSRTIMSSLYTDKGQRFDWGFVKMELKDGNTINIRPASDIEISYYENKIKMLLEELEEREKRELRTIEEKENHV